MIPLLGPFTCHSCDMGSVFPWVFSFENHTSASIRGVHLSATWVPGRKSPRARFVLKWHHHDILWPSSHTSVDLHWWGFIFFPDTEFFSSIQTSLTFLSMIVVLWPFNHKLVKLSLKISLNNLERRECDSLRGVWFLMPSQHRKSLLDKILSQSYSTFQYFILVKSRWKETQNHVTG